MKLKPLTDNQKVVFGLIKKHPRTTLMEIAVVIGRSERAAWQHVVALEKKGYVRRKPHKQRCIEIIDQRERRAVG